MGSILTSGNGLDGFIMPNASAYNKLGTMNIGSCTVNSLNTKTEQVVTNTIHQSSEESLEALASGAAIANYVNYLQGILIHFDGDANSPTSLTPPTDYSIGAEISLGDHAAGERGDLNNILQGYVSPTGFMRVDGKMLGVTGAILNPDSVRNSASIWATYGTLTTFGSDNTSGIAAKIYTNFGGTSVPTITKSR